MFEMIGEHLLCYGDCLQLMPHLAPGSIDLILADLPYGTTRCSWDSLIPLNPLWEQYERLLSSTGSVVLTASQPFTSVLVLSKVAWFRWEWIWQKDAGTGFLNASKAPLKDHESVLVFSTDTPLYNPQMRLGFKPYRLVKGHHGACYGKDRGAVTESDGSRYPLTTIKFDREKQDRAHSTQKPIALIEYLIRTHSNRGQVVLDNTMGSGTTGVACINTGRKFIGMELNDEIYGIACDRVRSAYIQPGLFRGD